MIYCDMQTQKIWSRIDKQTFMQTKYNAQLETLLCYVSYNIGFRTKEDE